MFTSEDCQIIKDFIKSQNQSLDNNYVFCSITNNSNINWMVDTSAS